MSWEGGLVVIVQQPKGAEMQDIWTAKQRQQEVRHKVVKVNTRDDMEPKFKF